MDKKAKSLVRAKKTSSSIVDMVGREVCATVVPVVGGVAYDTVKAMFNHGKEYIKDRNDTRIEDFHTVLLTGEFNQPYEEFIEKPFELGDYHALLNSCVQDMEDEKVSFYGTLMKSLISLNLKENDRRHFVKACRELSFSELQFLRKIYVHSEFRIWSEYAIPEKGGAEFLKTKKPIELLILDRLKAFGLINYEKSEMTELGKNFIEAVFSKPQLKPKAIGLEEFSGVNVVVISYKLSDDFHSSTALNLQNGLAKMPEDELELTLPE